MSTLHFLKTWPTYFAALLDGSKLFEIRKDDRHYQVGDILVLQEWEPPDSPISGRGYTGREIRRIVTYKTDNGEWLKEGMVALGLKNPEMIQRPAISCCQQGCHEQLLAWRECAIKSCGIRIGCCERHGGDERAARQMEVHRQEAHL